MSHSQGEDLSVRPQRQGKGKRDLHKNGLRSLFRMLQFSLRVKKPEASENVPWNAEREFASQGDCPDCQQEAAEISNQSSNHSSRQKSHAYGSHVKLWHEQNSGNKLPPLNVIQTGGKKKKTQGIRTQHSMIKDVQSGMRSEGSMQDTRRTNSTESSST